MEGATYVQIVAIREEEKDAYLKVALAHCDLDVFVIKERHCPFKTIGQARHALKMLGERITLRREWIFMCDDNISHWSGVTLINDPCPMFGKEPSEESQLTDISLYKILSHFSSKSFKEAAKFSILGFSMFSKRQIRKKRSAYARAHVFAAVLLNLKKLTKVNYNKRAWAMEDIAFNRSTNELSSFNPDDGVIVQARRYVAYKKVNSINKTCFESSLLFQILGIGGVVPMDVPEDVQVHLENNAAWSDSEKHEKRRNLRKERNSQTDSPLRGTQGSDQSRHEPDHNVGRAGGKCQLGRETKGIPRKDKKEIHSQAKSRSSQKTDIGAKKEHSKMLGGESIPSKRKADDDSVNTNPGKLARTETKQVLRETTQSKGEVAHQQRTRGDQSERKSGDKRECCSKNKNYSELFSLIKNMKEEMETERKERDEREELLTARIEELERREKERKTSE